MGAPDPLAPCHPHLPSRPCSPPKRREEAWTEAVAPPLAAAARVGTSAAPLGAVDLTGEREGGRGAEDRRECGRGTGSKK